MTVHVNDAWRRIVATIRPLVLRDEDSLDRDALAGYGRGESQI